MDKFLKRKRGIDEVDAKSDRNLSVKRCTSKKAKPQPTRKYDDSHVSFGFSWTGSDDNPLSECLVCGIKMSNESMVPSKLGKHFKNKHSYLQNKPTSYFKRMSEQLTKTANSFKSIVTVSDKAQIASYQVSELVAQNMKGHTLGESIILSACKKIVSTLLGNEAALKITKISLSDDTVCRRILEISFDIEKNVNGNKL